MNYWSSEFEMTGERAALDYVASRLRKTPEPVLFDVGANVGTFSLACLDAFDGRCQLHAFEPASATFERLRSTSALAIAGVLFHKLALSDHEGTAILHSSEACASIASLERLGRPVRPFVKELDEQVALTTVDQFCQCNEIERIDLLKLDIEGHELAALRGAERMLAENRIRFIQFEFGENNVSSRTYLADFDSVLGRHFDMFRIVPGGLVPWLYEGGRSELFATMNYLCERRAKGPN